MGGPWTHAHDGAQQLEAQFLMAAMHWQCGVAPPAELGRRAHRFDQLKRFRPRRARQDALERDGHKAIEREPRAKVALRDALELRDRKSAVLKAVEELEDDVGHEDEIQHAVDRGREVILPLTQRGGLEGAGSLATRRTRGMLAGCEKKAEQKRGRRRRATRCAPGTRARSGQRRR